MRDSPGFFSQEPASIDRSQFLNLAALLQGSLVLLAVGLGWLTDTDPFARLSFDWSALGWGILGVLPMLLVFAITYALPLRPLKQIRAFLNETLGPLLQECRWFDLILLAALAGITEEILFRGFLQPFLTEICRDSPLAIPPEQGGLILTSILFGVAHLITPTYGVMAGLMGAYLSWLQMTAPEQNLLAPVTTHAVYDWIAFLVVLRGYRSSREASRSESPESSM